MAFNTILTPTVLDDSGLVFDWPNITALSDGSFALSFVDFAITNSVITYVYSAQGAFLGGGPAMPEQSTQFELDGNLAGLAGGGYALAWTEFVVVGNFFENVIYSAVYDAQGNQITTPTEASGGTIGDAIPDVTALPGGGYVLTWSSATSADGSSDIWTRIFDSAGAPVTPAIDLTGALGQTDQLTFRATPIAVLPSGNLVYSWSSSTDTQNGDVYSAIYAPDGQQLLGPTNLSNTTDVIDSNPQIAVLQNGGYAMAWFGEAVQGGFVYTAVFDANGDQIAAPFVVAPGQVPDMVALSNGDYALAWANGDIFTAVFDAHDALVSGVINITNTVGLDEGDVKIAALENGTYALTWSGQANGTWDLFTAVYDAQGNARIAAQNVTNTPTDEDVLPAIASQGNGTYAITWMNTLDPFWGEKVAIFRYVDETQPDNHAPEPVADTFALTEDGVAAHFLPEALQSLPLRAVDGTPEALSGLSGLTLISVCPVWCVPCRAFSADSAQLQSALAALGVSVLEIIIDDDRPDNNTVATAADAAAWVAQTGSVFETWHVDGSVPVAARLADALGITAFPHYVLYDPATHSIVSDFEGYGGVQSFVDGIADVLAHGGPSGPPFADNVIYGATHTDTDPDGDVLRVSEVNGDGSFVDTTITLASGARLTMDANGAFKLDPHGAYNHLSASESTTETFTYTVSDGHGGSASTTVTLNIAGANDPAQFAVNAIGSATEDVALIAIGSLSANDPDDGESGFQVETATGTYGSLQIDAGGAWTYTLTQNATLAVQSLAVSSAPLQDTLAVHAIDGTATTIRIDIFGSNDPAVIGGTITGAVTKGGNQVANGLLTISDPDAGEDHFFAGTFFNAAIKSGVGFGQLDITTDGHWTYTLDLTLPQTQALLPGEHATDLVTIASADGTTQTITIDVVVPAAVPTAPLITGFTPDTGVQGDHITEAHTLVVSGTSAAGAVAVRVSDGAGLTLVVAPGAGGSWSAQFSALPLGSYEFTATAVDAFGNISASSEIFTIDVVTPPPPVITGFSPDTGTQGDHITEAQTFTVSGTSEPGTVQVQVSDGHGHVVAVAPEADGGWSAIFGNLPLAVYDFTAVAVNELGDHSFASKVFEISVLDLTPPAAPIITGFTPDTGIQGDHITESHTLVVSGTSEPGVKNVHVSDGAGHTIAVQAQANGDWSAQFNALPFGSYSFTATAVDASGNVSASSGTFAIDVAPIPPPVITGFTPDTGAQGDHSTEAQFLTISGTSEPGTLRVTVSDGTFTVVVTPDQNGNWSTPAHVFPLGSHSFTATAKNVLGDVSVASKIFDIDIVPPPAPVITGFSPDTGVVGDHITQAASITVSGSGEPGLVQVQVSDGHGHTVTVTPAADGSWSAPFNNLVAGTYDFTAVAINDGGNVSGVSKAFEVIVDPAPPVITSNGGGTTATVSIAENTSAVTMVHATDADNQTVHYAIVGGADRAKFLIDAATGALSFVTPPDFEAPADADGNNGYVVQVSATDGVLSDLQTITVNVTDANGVVRSGTALADVLTGTPEADTLSGLGGNDQIHGLAGDDTLNGGAGNDLIDGGAGNDVLDGGTGVDNMAGGTGDDVYVVDNAGDVVTEGLNEGTDEVRSSISYTLGANVENLTLTGNASINGIGNALDNVITGNGSANSLAGGLGNDVLTGGGSNDVLDGGAGDDRLDGGGGADAMAGGQGNDVFIVDNAGDVVSESPNQGIDEVIASIDYTLGANLENLTLTGRGNPDGTGNGLDNVISGNGGNNTLSGGAGNDTLSGGAGDDTLDGGSGADAMAGGAGDDTYVVDNTSDTVTEGLNQGVDEVRASLSYTLGVNVENLTLTGSAIVDGIGNALDNRLTGNSAHNVLDGGAGADRMEGGGGDDVYIVDNSGDVVVERANQGFDQVLSSVTFTLGGNVESLMLIGNANIDGTGNALDNVIVGNSGNNTLLGGGGDDRLDGGAGIDTLVGGNGDDTYVVDNPADIVVENARQGTDQVFASASYTLGANIEILTLTGSLDINGTGNALDNTLTGNSGDNRLDGGVGSDAMAGGVGADTYVVDNVGDSIVEGADKASDQVFASVSFVLPVNVENLTLTGNGNIAATGNAVDNVLTGNARNNVLTGLGGNDTLDGGAGADTMTGGIGDDLYFVDNVGDVVAEGVNQGNDEVRSSVTFALGANVEKLTLIGAADISGTGNGLDNVITGNAGRNVLSGGDGQDRIDGGAGADVMIGGKGGDIYFVDDPGDVIIETPLTAADTVFINSVFASVSYALSDNIQDLILTGTGNINGTGNDLANRITGTAGDNIIAGGGGNDTLQGGEGSDTYLFGLNSGFDLIDDTGTTGTDVMLAIAGNITINIVNFFFGGSEGGIERIDAGGHEGVVLQGSAGPMGWDFSHMELIGIARIVASILSHGQIIGSAGDDVLDGSRSDFVTLRGGAGDDTLIGGGGSDTVDGEEGSDTYLIGTVDPDRSGDVIRDTGTIGIDTILATADNTSISILGGNFVGIERIDAGGHTGVTIVGATASPFGWNFSQTELIGIERIVAGRATHGSIIGSAADDVLDGSHSDSITLRGGAGNDTLIGGFGSDTLDGGEGSDTYLIGPRDPDLAGDIISDTGTTGIDTILATADNISIAIAAGNFEGIERIDANEHTGVTIAGTSAAPFDWNFSQAELIDITRIVAGNFSHGSIVGSASDDVLDGSRSQFIELHGGAGDDTLIGGTGNDTLSGDLGADTFVFNFGADIVADYEVGLDQFDFTAVTGLEAYSDLQPFMSDVATGVLIDFGGGNSITIQNTLVATLNAHQNDFLF